MAYSGGVGLAPTPTPTGPQSPGQLNTARFPGGVKGPSTNPLPTPRAPSRGPAIKAQRTSHVVRAPRPSRGPARGRPGPPMNPLLNPNMPLSGSALQQAATALADAQTKVPITELNRAITNNQNQTAAAQKNTAGYFGQLGQFVNQSNQQLGNISAGLNSTLGNIGAQTQQSIGQAFTPSVGLQNLARQGLAQGATDQLNADQARQQGFAAQDAGTFRSAGAIQGANAQMLGAGNLGSYSQRGQELLGKIGQAGQLENEPLNSKIAGLTAQRGALISANEGKLRQAEITDQVTRAGLGLKQDALAVTQQNDLANQGLKAAGINAQNQRTMAQINAANSRNAASLAQSNLNNLRTTQTSAANNAASNATRTLVAQLAAQRRANKTATPQQANAIYSHIDYLSGELNNLTRLGYPPQSAYHIIQNGGRVQVGTSSTGKPVYKIYQPNKFGVSFLNAAYNVRSGGGGLTGGDVNWLSSLGVSPGKYGPTNRTGTNISPGGAASPH